MSGIRSAFCYTCGDTTRWYQTRSGAWHEWSCEECKTTETAQLKMQQDDARADDMDRREQNELRNGIG